MSCKSSRSLMMTALVAGAGAISVASLAGMAGVMSMQKMTEQREPHMGQMREPHQIMGVRKCGHMMDSMGHRMACMGNEFADELCMMAHKTGNAMIKTGRMINRMVP